MPQKQKTPKPLTRHKPVKKKTPPASSLSKLHWNWKVLKQTLLIILGLGILFLIALNRYHAHQTHLAQQAQLTRLNAASTDLKKVYDQLLTTLPNIREHSFEKSCGQSSDVLNNGTITCGSAAHFLMDNLSLASFSSENYKTIELAKGEGFIKVGQLSVNSSFRDSQLESQTIMSRNDVRCSVSGEYFNEETLYRRLHYDDKKNYEGGINALDIYCKETAADFLPGYTVEK